ncbi:hypothetical protein C8R44DRAFT_802387 [Mycena epipterygia]|nr:hypothetical protein C8R44DRAFT_802387 [Mycena epipterygia]
MKSKRCFHFDLKGRPIGKGCINGFRCYFAHPEDPEWDELPPGLQRTPGSAGKYHSYQRSRSKSPHRERAPRPRSRSRSLHRPRARSRSSSPSRHQRASASDSRMDSRAGPSDPYRGSRSSVASTPAPPYSAFSSASFAAPPPILPPPLLPAPPALPAAFITSEAAVAPKQPATSEEMKVMWEKVLPLMANCVEARKEHQDSQRNLQDFERMLQTPRYTVLITPADQQRVDRQLAELKALREEKGREVTAALHALKETNWWPVGPNQDEGAADKYRDLVQYALQLNSTAAEMYKEYVKKAHHAPAAPAPLLAVQIPAPESSSRPLKRRRLSSAAPALDPADAADLDTLRDKLEMLEDRIENIHNDVLTLETQNEEDIVARIESKLESFSLEPYDRAGPNSAGLELEQVDQRVKKATHEAGLLAQEVVNLMEESAALRSQTEALTKEREKDLEEMEQMQKAFQEYEEASTRDRAAMEALSTALKAYRDQPPAPASVPLDFLLTTIDEPVRDTVRAAVQPIVNNMTKELEETILKQDRETYGHLWGKIALTLKVVDAVSKVTPERTVSVS